MKILNVTQGSPEWLAARAGKFCASDAPAVMNASKYKSRADLLREMAGAGGREVSATEQKLFDRGHETEAAIRPYIESLIGEELYPVTVTDDEGRFLASMDGLTMAGDVGFEHKLINKALADDVAAGVLDNHYVYQLEHQLLVTGAEKIIFVASDGTPENCVHMEYRPAPGRRERLIAAWNQLEIDLANYQHVEVLPAAVADPVMSLPSVSVQVDGQLTVTSNFVLFGEKLAEFVGKIDKNPSDDQAFANCEAAIKVLVKAEDALDAAESSALAQITCIDEMVTLKQSLHKMARDNRLMLEKLVKARKEAIRIEIQQTAKTAYDKHVAELTAETEGVWLNISGPDFPGVMRNKRTITSLRDAVDGELANAKIAASESAKNIRAALACLKQETLGYEHLFADRINLISKPIDDLRVLVKARITEHKAVEEKKLEAEREKIRIEESAKAKAEAEAKLKAEQAEQVKPVTQPIVTEVKTSQPDPVVTSVSPSPVRTVHAVAKPSRPTSAEIIFVLANHYAVSEDTVIDWLAQIDLAEVA